MAAISPQEAATKWEQRTQQGAAKYRAKITQMHQNFATGLQRFWGVSPGTHHHGRLLQAARAGVQR